VSQTGMSDKTNFGRLAEEARKLPTLGAERLSDNTIAAWFQQHKLEVVVALEYVDDMMSHDYDY